MLGGKVARAAADYLTNRSAGNPLVLQGLVVGAEEEGSLRKVNNVWVLDHPANQLGVESWEFLQMELDHVPPGSRRIIEILALAGPLPLEALLDLTGPESVDDIQQRELVEIVPGEILTMRLARQATAASIRAIVPVGRSRRLLAEVVLPWRTNWMPRESSTSRAGPLAVGFQSAGNGSWKPPPRQTSSCGPLTPCISVTSRQTAPFRLN